MRHKFLVHDPRDSVGVAVAEIGSGEEVVGTVLDGGGSLQVRAREAIPLGHKLALAAIGHGDVVIEYGVPIGKAARAIAKGEHVHVHNLKSARW